MSSRWNGSVARARAYDWGGKCSIVFVRPYRHDSAPDLAPVKAKPLRGAFGGLDRRGRPRTRNRVSAPGSMSDYVPPGSMDERRIICEAARCVSLPPERSLRLDQYGVQC